MAESAKWWIAQLILEGSGWTLYRVWSTDWWHDSEAETKKLLSFIQVVAIAPYGILSNAVMNICHDYGSFLPKAFIRAGLEQLPVVLGVQSDELDMTTVLSRQPVSALFVTGTRDDIIPPEEIRALFNTALPDSKLIVVPEATHEALPYYFTQLVPPVLAWLDGTKAKPAEPN